MRAWLRSLAVLVLVTAAVSTAVPECPCPSARAVASFSGHACCSSALALRSSDHDCCPAGRSPRGPTPTVSLSPLPLRAVEAAHPPPVLALPTVVSVRVPVSPSPPAICLRI
jgi:hypothetical protein